MSRVSSINSVDLYALHSHKRNIKVAFHWASTNRKTRSPNRLFPNHNSCASTMDHLCPRHVFPQAACLQCLSQPTTQYTPQRLTQRTRSSSKTTTTTSSIYTATTIPNSTRTRSAHTQSARHHSHPAQTATNTSDPTATSSSRVSTKASEPLARPWTAPTAAALPLTAATLAAPVSINIAPGTQPSAPCYRPKSTTGSPRPSQPRKDSETLSVTTMPVWGRGSLSV